MEFIQELLTVVIPVYNGEKYLKSTVDAVLAAEYRKLEVLLIDDGSMDKSSAVCKELAAHDARVSYIRQENSGIAGARNKGLELAKGEYVCFCDQDDVTEKEMYREILEKMQTENAQMGMCSTGQLCNGKKLPYEHVEDGSFCGEEVRDKLLYPILFRGYDYSFAKSPNYIYGTVWKCIFRRDFLETNNMGFRRFINYEDDWLFVTEALSYASGVVACSSTGYYWRVERASESHTARYIEDIAQKMELFDSYVYGFLRSCIVDKAVFGEYIKISLCEHFVDLYRNEAGLSDAGQKKAYRRTVGEYLRRKAYKEQLSCGKHLRKSAFRRRLIYVSLKYFGIGITFYTSRATDMLERGIGNISGLILLERKAKKV